MQLKILKFNCTNVILDFTILFFKFIDYKYAFFEINQPTNLIEKIPTEFWMHRAFTKLPALSKYRRDLCAKLVDGHHRKNCRRTVTNPKDFHLESDIMCICKHCNRYMEWFHVCKSDDDVNDTDNVTTS